MSDRSHNTGDARVDFRQPPTIARLIPRTIIGVILLLAGAAIPIAVTFDTPVEDFGFGVAVVATLLMAGVFAWSVYRAMTPMTIIASRKGVTLIDRNTGDEQTLAWNEIRFSYIPADDGAVLLLHDRMRTIKITEHPVYARSPREFVALCDIVIEHGRPLGSALDVQQR